MSDAAPVFLTAQQVVARWDGAVTVNTLAKWRGDPKRPGPEFVRFGSKVRYPLDAVTKWESERRFASTHDFCSPEVNAKRRAA